MKIIYYCYTGRLLSLIAGYIHLGQLDKVKAICSGENWQENSWKTIKEPLFLGTDSKGNEIYTLGVAFEDKVIVKALENLWQDFGIDRKAYKLISVIPKDDFLLKLSIFLLGQSFGKDLGRSLYLRRLTGHLGFIENRVSEVQSL